MLIINLLIEKGSEHSLRDSSGKVLEHSHVYDMELYKNMNDESLPYVLYKYQCHVENYALVKDQLRYFLPKTRGETNKFLWTKAEEFTRHLEDDCLEFTINFKCF